MGSGVALSGELCRAMRDVLAGTDPAGVTLSKRASSTLGDLRAAAPWATPDTTAVVREDGKARWWTFAGFRADGALHGALGHLRASNQIDNLFIEIGWEVTLDDLNNRLAEIEAEDLPRSPLAVRAAAELKFADCLPTELALDIADARLGDPGQSPAEWWGLKA